MRAFISYPTNEMSFVTLLRDTIVKAGISCFVANWDLEYGKLLWPTISEEIIHSDVMFVLYTDEGAISAWVNQEIAWAIANKIVVVPIAERKEDLKAALEGMKYIAFDRHDPIKTINDVVSWCQTSSP